MIVRIWPYAIYSCINYLLLILRYFEYIPMSKPRGWDFSKSISSQTTNYTPHTPILFNNSNASSSPPPFRIRQLPTRTHSSDPSNRHAPHPRMNPIVGGLRPTFAKQQTPAERKNFFFSRARQPRLAEIKKESPSDRHRCGGKKQTPRTRKFGRAHGFCPLGRTRERASESRRETSWPFFPQHPSGRWLGNFSSADSWDTRCESFCPATLFIGSGKIIRALVSMRRLDILAREFGNCFPTLRIFRCETKFLEISLLTELPNIRLIFSMHIMLAKYI